MTRAEFIAIVLGLTDTALSAKLLDQAWESLPAEFSVYEMNGDGFSTCGEVLEAVQAVMGKAGISQTRVVYL